MAQRFGRVISSLRARIGEHVGSFGESVLVIIEGVAVRISAVMVEEQQGRLAGFAHDRKGIKSEWGSRNKKAWCLRPSESAD
jgi:hypothetical protein